jgi:hypothetical protein
MRGVCAQIVEEDISGDAKAARRTVTSDKVAVPGTSGIDASKAVTPTAARILLPALKEVVQGLASQYELMKEVVAAVQVRSGSSLSVLCDHPGMYCQSYFSPNRLCF